MNIVAGIFRLQWSSPSGSAGETWISRDEADETNGDGRNEDPSLLETS